MKSLTWLATGVIVAGAAFVLLVPPWMKPPRSAEEVGFPQEINFHDEREMAAINQVPPAIPAQPEDSRPATVAYQNVKVLTDVNASEFMRLQYAITEWVSPQQGCAFCHVGSNWADDAKPQKAAARVMLQMTRHLNTDWSNHVATAGVTCYTCHRGNPAPPQTWFPSVPKPEHRFIARQDDWNEAADTVRKFFPDAGFAEYYLGNSPIVVQSQTVEPTGSGSSFVEAKRIYEMMMQMSDGIGANCGLCHNSRAFQSWEESSPYRWVGYDALRLVRDVNQNYLLPVAAIIPQTRTLPGQTRLPVLPAAETGPQEGNGFVACATCHYGVLKPLGGVNMAHDFPGLAQPAPTTSASNR